MRSISMSVSREEKEYVDTAVTERKSLRLMFCNF